VTIVDLTQPLEAGMPFNPDHFPPEIAPYAAIESHGWRATRLVLDSHLGTHLDAPSHFVPGGQTLEQVPLDRLIGPAEVVRLEGIAARTALMPEHVPESPCPRLLLHTGWAERTYGSAAYFSDYPWVSPELARVLVDRGVVLVGLDAPSVDYDPGDTHRVLLEAGVVIVENVANLAAVPDRIRLTVLPLPIVGGDGCPARAVAEWEARSGD
jgi:kynurenine formamidase